MKYPFLVFACLLLPIILFGQRKPKPTLLVYGNGLEAYAAAVQGALSNVPTLWVMNGNLQDLMITEKPSQLTINHSLDGGIWMKLLMEMADYKSPNDSVATIIKQDITIERLLIATNQLVQKLPPLTIVESTSIKKIAWGRKGWQAQLSNGKRYTFRSVIDASTDQGLASVVPEQDRWKPEANTQSSLSDLQRARTTLAIGTDRNSIRTLTTSELLRSVKNNFFSLQSLSSFEPSVENIPLRMHYAQAIGAAAGYTAFFEVDAAQIDVRKLQSELLTYKSRLLPAIDAASEHPHFGSWQKIYLTGLFPVENNRFSSEKEVTYSEIRPILQELYSRSQLWFLDHDGEELLWKDAIELVKFLGTRGQEVNRQIATEWNNKLQFDTVYDLDRPITRGEFSVILDQFANPYGVTVTHAGEVRR
ncbi:hypothetical protein [Sphingobacterium corticibacter]|uniref:FAD-dependent oxidoreductase n=1 Tax=Sphingobacterium corticibacter TaxID=2171749 RepID=A0A2T8HFG1_9SPHI|nr:hypothetical protein [Sphingobacterium corticibacter]PVH24155.1 hypothetical protein DC487_15585 [Sphingobacterium corticibacter]